MHLKLFGFSIFLCVSMLAVAQPKPDSPAISRAAFVKSKTVKSDSLNSRALKLAVLGASNSELNHAIELVMGGLRTYSKYRDTTGLVQTFNNLSYIYHLQKKYPQAKWFILQSNSMSRDKRDTLAIISSLIKLAVIKEEIKDFDLAKKDLNEASQLAKKQPTVSQQIDVQNAIAHFYSVRGDKTHAGSALSQIIFLKDSVSRKELAKRPVPVNNIKSVPETLRQAATTPQPETKAPITNNEVWVMAGAVILILSAGVGLFYYQSKQRRNKNKD